MKTTSTFIGTALLLAAGVGGTTLAAGRFQLKPVQKEATVAKTERPEILSRSEVTPEPLKSPEKEPSVTRAQEILVEDFSNVPDGETETIEGIGERYTDFIASHYFEPGRYVDNAYTPESGTWEGDWAFAGKNGTIILQAYNPMRGACINTPLGDYSGDLTVTVRARWARTFWGANTETGYTSTKGSDFSVALRIGGYDSNNVPVSDATWGQLSSGQIYENDGWTEFTFTLRNEGADKDGYLSISTTSAIEIDYIKVTDAATFLACPVVRQPSNFTDDGFTISWDPVRRSFNYYIDLWRVNYTADKGISEYYDFESGSLPEGTTADGPEIEDGAGIDGSKGLRLDINGVDAAFATPDFGKNLGSVTFTVYFDVPTEPTNDDMDPEWGLGTLLIDGLTDDGWQPVSSVMADGFWTPGGYFLNYVLDGAQFEGRYKGLRFYAEGFKAPYSVVLDNLALWGARPFELISEETGTVFDPENDNPYDEYYHTEHGDPCSYTFAGLDPEGEYWYRVRSHNVNDFSVSEKHHAFGVAAPRLLEATNVGSGSYTANWTDAPKAQSYLLRNYDVTKIAADENDYQLFNETFQGCTGGSDLFSMVPLNNAEGYLDDYTDMPGWTGRNNSVGQNLIGCGDYSGGTLVSPALPVNPARGNYYVYIEAYGYNGDTFCIDFLESGLYSYIPVPEDGYLNGYLSIPAESVRENERLWFSSYNGLAFAVGALEITQNVEAGDLLRTFSSEVEVPAGIGSYTFSNLGEGQMFAYQPVSKFKLEKDAVYSTSGDYMVVDMANGSSFITDKVEIAADAVETGRFNTSGVRVDRDYKGLVIITMSDGSVRKEIVK